ncbi:hypothetical protein QTP88_027420 [Uroleucon formosanum]
METYDKLVKVFGDEALSRAQRVRTLVRQDRSLTVRMLADELNLKRETVRKILTDDLFMKKLRKYGTEEPFGGAKTRANVHFTGLSGTG